MSSAEDADDERESAAPTPVQDWVDPKSLKFTLFIVLPNDEVCTLRDLPSGISVQDLKARLELQAGLPSQLYNFFYPNGEELREDQRLVVQETILNGYLLKVHIHDNWETLYLAVSRNCIEQVYHSGGVHLKGNIIISPKESDRYDSVVRERGSVALFMASSFGLQRMANMLISVGVSVNCTTPFGRTPLHAAVAKDHMTMVEFLLNLGASLQHADRFGVVPLALAKQLSSSACFRKLRLMHLNLRGNPSNALNKKSIMSAKTFKSPSHQDARNDSSKGDRIHLTMTQSKDSTTSPKHNFSSTIHASRKHLSASAPLNESGRKVLSEARDGTYSSLSNATTGKIRQSKGNVKWKDTKTEYVYWKNLGTHTKTPREMEDTVKVKPMALAEPRAIIKYSNIAKQNSQKSESEGAETRKENEELVKAMEYSKNRLKHFQKLAQPPDNYVPIAYRKKSQEPLTTEDSPAFRNWLDRKTIEIEEAEENKSSSEEYFNLSDPEEDKMVEFNRRVRKKNREAVRNAKSAKAGNRPVPEVLKLGSTTCGDGRNPPAEENISAYKEWRRNKASCVSVPRGKSANDFIVERRRLEEKRQKLLMNAISYEEWLYHTEERKMLIKQILRADYDEMKKMEEEKFRDREKLYSYDVWTERLKKRELDDKKRKEIQRKYDEDCQKEKTHVRKSGGGGTTEPFDEWLNTKRFTMSKESERHSATGRSEDQRSAVGSARTPKQNGDGLIHNDWVLKKRHEEIGSLDERFTSEHKMNGKVINLPTVTLAT